MLNTPTFYALRMNFHGRIFFCSLLDFRFLDGNSAWGYTNVSLHVILTCNEVTIQGSFTPRNNRELGSCHYLWVGGAVCANRGHKFQCKQIEGGGAKFQCKPFEVGQNFRPTWGWIYDLPTHHRGCGIYDPPPNHHLLVPPTVITNDHPQNWYSWDWNTATAI